MAVLVSQSAFALFGIGEDDESDGPPKDCYYSIHISTDKAGKKVFYIFKALCGGINQVGIIDEPQKLVMEIDNGSIDSEIRFYNDSKKDEIVNEKWGDPEPIEFFE